MTQIYKRKFSDSDIFEQIFLRVIKLAEDAGYIDYETIYGDATHIKANANKRKYKEQTIETISQTKSWATLDLISRAEKKQNYNWLLCAA